jgi:hypothetical protein
MPQTQSPQSRADRQDDLEVHPVVVVSADDVTTKRRKKKRGSSRNLRRLDDIEYRTSKSFRRVTRAVNRGVDVYFEKRDASERKRQDGAITDFLINSASGVSEAIAGSAYVLVDWAEIFTTNRRRRMIRRLVRSFPLPF